MSLFQKRNKKRQRGFALDLEQTLDPEDDLAEELGQQKRDHEEIRKGRFLGKHGGVFSVEATNSTILKLPEVTVSIAEAKNKYVHMEEQPRDELDKPEPMNEENIQPLATSQPHYVLSTSKEQYQGPITYTTLSQEGMSLPVFGDSLLSRAEANREMNETFRARKLDSALEEFRRNKQSSLC